DRTGDSQPGHYETLLAAQRAWLAYRDAQCRSESFMARGGSMQPMLELQCKAYMTELRIQQLRLLIAGPGN
ncbi:MAG TPA: lysozyme inhibitor LprI family protein, partial [Croceibacterium sp.]|nr:lysozyme inhibitor LprI family protein [Croceibacterium sp.]